MDFVKRTLSAKRPARLADVHLPRRQTYYPSPADWRNEVLYFLLPDRFSDGEEATRPLLNRADLATARPAIGGQAWRWDLWAESGAQRWQGGTLAGIKSKLGYLKRLGITALWIGPVFRQRGHLDSYHGYGIQDFLEVDPRLGSRADLVELVAAAHERDIRVILDIIFNHSGPNWLYPADTPGGMFTPHYTPGRYPFGHWRDAQGDAADRIARDDDGVWPTELQDTEGYTRAGFGSLGAGDISDPDAEHKRTDFFTLRDFNLKRATALSALAQCYKYWIALTDCDGFRIDTLKHVSLEEARNFCGTIKEFASNLGKHDFFLVGEIAGGDRDQDRYLDVLARNLNAALDIGEMRPTLQLVAKGLIHPQTFFQGFDPGAAVLGSHRNLGDRHVSILDDHDHVFGDKIRFSSEAVSEHQVVAGVALQLFSLGIPCIYYGTEQAFAGPEPGERQWLPGWKGGDHADRYLREAMFGPAHPRASGLASAVETDSALPGFGPFGTAGHHCFDEAHPVYQRIAALCGARQAFPVLRLGRQYPRSIRFLDFEFGFHGPGELIAWSRILDDEEALCLVNAHGLAARGADVIVDATLNTPRDPSPQGQPGPELTVIANSAQAIAGGSYTGSHPVGSQLEVKRRADGTAFVEIRDVPPAEVLILINHP